LLRCPASDGASRMARAVLLVSHHRVAGSPRAPESCAHQHAATIDIGGPSLIEQANTHRRRRSPRKRRLLVARPEGRPSTSTACLQNSSYRAHRPPPHRTARPSAGDRLPTVPRKRTRLASALPPGPADRCHPARPLAGRDPARNRFQSSNFWRSPQHPGIGMPAQRASLAMSPSFLLTQQGFAAWALKLVSRRGGVCTHAFDLPAPPIPHRVVFLSAWRGLSWRGRAVVAALSLGLQRLSAPRSSNGLAPALCTLFIWRLSSGIHPANSFAPPPR